MMMKSKDYLQESLLF